MQRNTSTIGRAFELARELDDIDEIRKRLKEEGHFHVDAHLSGRTIRKDLRAAIDAA